MTTTEVRNRILERMGTDMINAVPATPETEAIIERSRAASQSYAEFVSEHYQQKIRELESQHEAENARWKQKLLEHLELEHEMEVLQEEIQLNCALLGPDLDYMPDPERLTLGASFYDRLPKTVKVNHTRDGKEFTYTWQLLEYKAPKGAEGGQVTYECLGDVE